MNGKFFSSLSFVGGFLFLMIGVLDLIYGKTSAYLTFSYFLMGVGLLMQAWLARKDKNLITGQIVYVTGCAVLLVQHLFQHGQQ